MAKRYLTHINLEQNELQNVVVHSLASAPSTPVVGQIYFNTVSEKYFIRQTTGWKDITGRLDDVLTTTNAVQLVDNSDGTYSIDILNATQVNAGLLSSADKTKLDDATSSATANTIVERDANGDITVNEINAVTGTVDSLTVTNAPVNPTDAVNKSYVDGLLTGGMTIVGGIDASVNPDYPAATQGDAYYVTVAGLVGGVSGEPVDIGDLVIAVSTNAGGTQASVGASWIILEQNIQYASETISGYIQLATQVEVDAGTEATKAVTPATLASALAGLDLTNNHSADVGDTVAKIFAITHTLNTTEVQVQIKDNGTLELVEADITITDANTVTVEFKGNAPALNEYKVIIQG